MANQRTGGSTAASLRGLTTVFTSTTARVHRFRHVVFAEPGVKTGPAINFAPAHADARGDDDTTAAWGRADGRTESRAEDAFLRWLFRAANLDAGRYRPESLRRRLGACLRAVRATSPAHARLLVSRNPSLMGPALGALLIGVTSLWRDPAVVAAMASALPGVAAGRSEVRVWSAGCSHGAELYTVAVVLTDLGILPRAYLLGTDCRAEATRRAAEGMFDAAEARNVPPALLREYFAPVPGGYQARADLRAAATWRTADLLKVHEPGTWDVILCRNVAMYMTSESAAALWARFETSLRPGGLLVLGRAERPLGAARMATVAPCIYKRSLG